MSTEHSKKLSHPKISAQFAARLEQLNPEQKVRAIVMLKTSDARSPLTTRRPTKTARRATTKRMQQSVAQLLPDIDRILKQYHGKRLKSDIGLLSAVPVITTPAGIDALTGSQHVKAILEDQAIFRVV